jgi:putative ATPase
VISPLLSRSLLLTLQPLDDGDLGLLIDRAVSDERGLAGTVELNADARDQLIRLSGGDARRALTILEAAAGAVEEDEEGRGGTDKAASVIGVETVRRAVDIAAVRYDKDGDQHYDVISAFIKSVRGSDVDAALGYLARMIEAGEDPRFIARRIIVLAAEDIGLADPHALPLAVAAAEAVATIGMPEGRIPLAEAVVYLASAPKSNAAYLGIEAALADVRAGRIGLVPAHLRDSHYAGAGRLGHGKGYVYAHDEPHAIAAQQYAPDELADARYYRPTGRGYERQVAERLEKIRTMLGRENPAVGTDESVPEQMR